MTSIFLQQHTSFAFSMFTKEINIIFAEIPSLQKLNYVNYLIKIECSRQKFINGMLKMYIFDNGQLVDHALQGYCAVIRTAINVS